MAKFDLITFPRRRELFRIPLTPETGQSASILVPDFGRRRLLSAFTGAAVAGTSLTIAAPGAEVVPLDPAVCRNEIEVEVLRLFRCISPDAHDSLLGVMPLLARVPRS